MLDFWNDISLLRTIIQTQRHKEIFIDFEGVLAFRKFASTQTFNMNVFEIAQKQGFFKSFIGHSNYSKYRDLANRKSFQMSDLLIDEVDFVDLEYNIDKGNLYSNPFVFSFIQFCIENEIEVYIVNNTSYSNKQLEKLLNNLSESLKCLQISNMRDSTEGIYLTKKINPSISIEQFEYDLFSRNEIDLEELYYRNIDEQFYLLRKSISQSDLCKSNIYFRIGALLLGPLMSVFVQVVYEDLKAKGINLILPLMREGDLLNEMLLNQIDSQPNSSINTKPLYVSRKATYLPSLSKNTTVDEIINYFSSKLISIEDLCKMFEIPICTKVDSSLNIFTLKQNKKGEFDTLIKHFKAFLCKEKMESFIQNKKELLQKYLHEIILDHKNVATIDIGFNGTIQENLELVSENVNYHHYLLFGHEGVLDKLKKNLTFSAYINSSDYPYIKDIIRCVDVFEQFVVGSTGSTLDYEVKDGHVVPICEALQYPNEEIKARKDIKDGITYFQKIFLSIENFKNNNFEFYLPTTGRALHRLIHKPLKMESEAVGKLHYSKNFGSLEYKAIIDFNKISAYKMEYLYQSLHASTLSTNVLWPQGILALKDSSYNMREVKYDFIREIYMKICHHLDKIRSGNLTIYGAGEIAKQIIHTLNVLNIQPIYLIDRNEKLHGTTVEGIEVISPSRLLEKEIKTVIIASYTFGAEIENDIKGICGDGVDGVTVIRIDE
ncbi:hypothetical protein [Lysinibacillus sp. NPDC093688]|uniref:nucleoside-diphosphate sugar epimerase/dehydratase n=1 Tax=Lysinibacillus sp. NPDC093688 TaxID=3390577 RepID=UPI003D03C038